LQKQGKGASVIDNLRNKGLIKWHQMN
jgi:hypothetical protein